MKRLGEWLIVVALAMGLATVSMALICAVARADTQTDMEYLAALGNRVDNTQGVAGIIEAGHQVCGLRENGMSDSNVVDYAYNNSAMGYAESLVLVHVAEEYYCPSYYVGGVTYKGEDRHDAVLQRRRAG